MNKRSFILFIVVILIVIFTTACGKTKKGYDYLVLVNKYSKLPDDWEKKIELVIAKDVDPNELMTEDGEYDKKLGWVTKIYRVGVLKYNKKNNSYSIENFGTGF